MGRDYEKNEERLSIEDLDTNDDFLVITPEKWAEHQKIVREQELAYAKWLAQETFGRAFPWLYEPLSPEEQRYLDEVDRMRFRGIN